MTLKEQIRTQRNLLINLRKQYAAARTHMMHLIERNNERFRGFPDLPAEVQQTILSLLSNRSLFGLAYVSKAFHAAYRKRKTAMMNELQPGRNLTPWRRGHGSCVVVEVKRQKNGMFVVCKCRSGQVFKRLAKIEEWSCVVVVGGGYYLLGGPSFVAAV